MAGHANPESKQPGWTMACDGLRECVIWNMILDEFCILTRKFVVRILFPVVIAIVGLLLSGMARSDDDAAVREARFASWMHAGLLDPEAPIEQRRAMVGELEAIAKDDSDPGVLYLLGSLYRQDPADSSSPVAQDLDRARELLSRAALRGKTLAMAKLSTIELQAGNYFEANTWAQLYCHYVLDRDSKEFAMHGNFAAMILSKAIEKFPEGKMDALESTVGAMIAKFDNQIRNPKVERSDPADPEQFTDPKLGAGVPIRPFHKGRRIESGMAEYVIELGANGKARKVWVLDSWPDPRLSEIMYKNVLGFRVKAKHPASTGGKIVVLPVNFDTRRYSMRAQSGKD